MTALRAAGQRVGVLAVDPSSPFSGGALLGDRVRMQDHATDEGVFIRSMASRGQLGGLSAAVPQALRVLDAAGCDIVLVETVGVGQAEVEIASLADTTLLVVAPGFGDGIQAAKAGIIEIADIFVVNKADRDGADQVVRDLRYMQSLGGRHSAAGAWRPPIVKTVAARGEGIDDVLAAIDEAPRLDGRARRARAPAARRGRRPRSRRSRSARSSSASRRCTARPPSTRPPPASSRARPTRTPRPTSSSPASDRAAAT